VIEDVSDQLYRYWALFLGRPTTMKSADLEVYQLTKKFQRLGTCMPAGPEKSLETQIYEALLDLMEHAGKVTEIGGSLSHNSKGFNHEVYTRVSALDAELSRWHSRLPPQLRWTSENIRTAPFSFFLLHQQYHCTLILLHRPFAMYQGNPANISGSPSGDGIESFEASNTEQQHDNLFSTLSRNVCTTHAIQISRIFWQHRQRFETRQIFVTGIQHAGTAAVSIIAALSYLTDPAERRSHMQYLECLAAALQDMTGTYKPAERMGAVLKSVMEELQDSIEGYSLNNGTVIGQRRCSTDVAPIPMMSNKRRQNSNARSDRSRSNDPTEATTLTFPSNQSPQTPPGIGIRDPSSMHNIIQPGSYDPLYEFVGGTGSSISSGWMGLDPYDHSMAQLAKSGGTAHLPPNYNQELDETLDFFAVMIEGNSEWEKGDDMSPQIRQ
jgi:hypothetical protein